MTEANGRGMVSIEKWQEGVSVDCWCCKGSDRTQRHVASTVLQVVPVHRILSGMCDRQC